MSELQTIESAPKDGTWFLAYRGPAKIGTCDRFAIVRWHDEFEDFIWPDEPFDIYRDDINEKTGAGHFALTPYESKGTFTHWMPLPSRPAQAKKDEQAK